MLIITILTYNLLKISEEADMFPKARAPIKNALIIYYDSFKENKPKNPTKKNEIVDTIQADHKDKCTLTDGFCN